jgi:aspartate dehydrogenase
MHDALPFRLGIAGLGNIGAALIAACADGRLPGFELVAVAGRNRQAVADRLQDMGCKASAVDLEALPEQVDVIVECLHPVPAVALIRQGLKAGRTVVALSAGALLLEPGLLTQAQTDPGRLIVPTGAILGLDVLRAAAVGRIDRVLVRTRKPPSSLAGARGLAGTDLSKATCVFAGNANEAVRAFPQNVNVAATISLGGIGGERTKVEIWADPSVDNNIHEVEFNSDCCTVKMQIVNSPSSNNPRTSAITLNSLIAALQSLTAKVRVGS